MKKKNNINSMLKTGALTMIFIGLHLTGYCGAGINTTGGQFAPILTILYPIFNGAMGVLLIWALFRGASQKAAGKPEANETFMYAVGAAAIWGGGDAIIAAISK